MSFLEKLIQASETSKHKDLDAFCEAESIDRDNLDFKSVIFGMEKAHQMEKKIYEKLIKAYGESE